MKNYQLSIKSYPFYKDSGVEWLGDVPEHWNIRRVKDVGLKGLTNGLFKKKYEFGFGVKLINVSDLYQGKNTINYNQLERVNATNDEINRYFVIGGDIFFVRSSLKLEGIGVSALLEEAEEKTVFECHIIRFRPNSKLIFPKFLKYLLNSDGIKWKFIIVSKTVTMTTISQEKISSVELATPPLPEQKAIAHYLDTKTAQIDRKIDLLTQKATQYSNLKQSLINETVTRGLDRSVPMKDSAIEWIGEVPEHWDINRLKDLSDIQNSNVDKKSNDNEIPIKLCNYVDVYKNDFINASLDFMDATANKEEIKRFAIKGGDVFITKDSETCDDIAIPALATESLEGVICGYHLAQFRVKEKVFLGSYLFRLFQSKSYGFRFVVSAKGITRVGLGQSAIADSLTPVPSLSEQKTIATYLDTKTAQIDQIIQTINTQIEKLKELRKTLINDVVTGKIKVTED